MRKLSNINIILAVILVLIIFLLIINDEKIGKGTLYIDNGLDNKLVIRIAFGKEDDNVIKYFDEDTILVSAKECKTYKIHKGYIRICYDTIVTKYNIYESGDWIFNPFRINTYKYFTVVYGGRNNNPGRTYTDELFNIDVDYLFQDPPSSLSLKSGSTATRTALTRIRH